MYILNNPYGELYTPAAQFKQRSMRKRKNKSYTKPTSKNVRGHKTMGHYRAPRRVKYVPKVRSRVQKKKKSRSAMSYFKHGLLGQQIRQSKKIKAFDDTIKYANYTYAGLEFFL